MPAAPVSALVAQSNIAEAVVDAAVVADILAPIAAIESVAIVVVAPIRGGPERALIGSLNPTTGDPVIAALSVSPITGCPEIVIAGGRGLIVVWQGRGRLWGVCNGLLAVTRIIVGLVGGLVIAPIIRGRGALLVSRRRCLRALALVV